jgi:glycosyltransferase involved in cell wall biosynthesis
MKKQPLISVIVPCYKVEKYLPKCVDSILRQSYQNLEIWLVDDGSPDRCGQICDDYAKLDNRVRVIHKANGGLSDARNVAIDQASGEWITFVDSDDYIADDYVETLWELVDKYDCEVSVALFKTFYEGEIPNLHNSIIVEKKMESVKAVKEMFYQRSFDTSAWAKLYNRRLFEDGIRYPKGLLYEDLATTYLLMLKSNGVAFVNKVIYYYLLRASSIEGEYSPKKIQSGLGVTALMDAHGDLLRPLEKAYRCRKFSLFYHLILPTPKDAEGRELLADYIKNNRWKVLIDKHARKKARMAAFLSFFGFGIIKGLFSFVNKR